jgi:hypothetical protein
MKLEKRCCPIEMTITKCGAGWTDFTWFVPERMSEPLFLSASNVGELMEVFVRSLYLLYPYDLSWDVAKFHFEEEPCGSDWVITRVTPENFDKRTDDSVDFTVNVKIILERDLEEGLLIKEFDFDFDYADICYAVSKAMTEVIKSHGIKGYCYSSSDIIDLLHLIHIKSIALGCDEVRKLKHSNNYTVTSDFAKEMEILMFDM